MTRKKREDLPEESASRLDAATTAKSGQVGYKRPPVATQFKKGRSGNPKGTKKSTGDRLGALARKVLAAPVTVTEGGVSRLVGTREAIAIRLIRDAISGKKKSIGKLLVMLIGSGALRTKRMKQSEYDQRVDERAQQINAARTLEEHERANRRVEEVTQFFEMFKARLISQGYRYVSGEPGDRDFRDFTDQMPLIDLYASLLAGVDGPQQPNLHQKALVA